MPVFVFRGEAIGIDDSRAPAFPDVAAEPERLVSQLCPKKPPSMTAPHKINTLIPEYPRCVEALRGIASGALIAAVSHGCTHGIRPASSSAMILSVISQ